MRLFTCVFFIVVILFRIEARDDEILFRNYDTSFGLPHNTINCIYQDKSGFIWIGTPNGLSRFDGHEFLTFNAEGSGIEDEIIRSITNKNDSVLLVCTKSILYELDLKTYTFNPVHLNKQSKSLVHVLADNLRQGYWLGTNDNGLYFITETDTLWYNNLTISSIGTDANNNIWAGTSTQGLWYYNSVQDTLINAISNTSRITCITYYSDSILFVGTRGAGLMKYNLIDKTHKYLKFNSGINNKSNVVNSILADKDELFLGTEGGLIKYNIRSGKYNQFIHNPEVNSSIVDNFTMSLFKDMEGGFWIGTFFRGISYIPAVNKGFTSVKPNLGKNGLDGSVISAFYELDDTSLCVGTEDNGMSIFDKHNEVFYKLPQYTESHYGNIHAITKVNNELWIGSRFGGVEKYNLTSGKTAYLKGIAGNQNSLLSNFVFDFYKMNESNVLIASGRGVAICNKGDNVTRINETVGMGCRDIVKHGQNYWFISRNNGICKWKTSDSTFHYYNIKNNKLLSDQLSCGTVDDNGVLWIASLNNGVFRYDPVSDKFNVEELSGDQEDIVIFSLESANNDLWLGTSKGLIKYNLINKKKITYTQKDGLPSSYFNSNASLKTKDNKLLFGTVNGYILFDPNSIKSNKYQPTPRITKIAIRNRKTDEKTTIIEPNRMQNIELAYMTNNIEFSFSAMSFNNPEANGFSYILEGFENSRTQTNDKYVKYSNLPFGNYRFKLWGSNDDLLWSEAPVIVAFKVLPPFWKSTIAYLLYLIVLLATISIIYLAMRKRVRLRLKLNAERTKYENDKKLNQFRINFFTNLVHEIKTPLTLIKTPLESMIKDQGLPGRIYHGLKVMDANTNRLLKLINQLLEFRRLEENKYELKYCRVDIINILKKIELRFKPYADSRHVDFSFIPDTNFMSLIVDQDAFIIIVSNLLTNALKFGNNEVIMTTDVSKAHIVEICIEDDGPGIPEDDLQRILQPFEQLSQRKSFKGVGIGLAFSKSLIELHKGELVLSNKTSGGLKAIVRFNTLNLPENLITNKISDIADAFLDETVPVDILDKEITIPKESDFIANFRNQWRVLLAEDDKELQDYIAKELHADFEIIRFGNGKDAFDYLTSCEIEPDIIISDLVMPVMDGLELCKAVKSSGTISNIPFLILSAKNSDADRINGLKAGADAYLHKPFNFEMLKTQIISLVEKSRNKQRQYQLKAFSKFASQLREVDNELVNKLIGIIEQDIENPLLNVEYLCEKLSMSRFTLYKKIKTLTGHTPKDFIIKIKLSKAAELICTTGKTMREVSIATGFVNISHFSIAFKKHYGCTPSAYRIKNSERHN